MALSGKYISGIDIEEDFSKLIEIQLFISITNYFTKLKFLKLIFSLVELALKFRRKYFSQ